MKDGGPAFPVIFEHDEGRCVSEQEGMSLRDYFAAKAMQVLIPDEAIATVHETVDAAYRWADAMLEARKK